MRDAARHIADKRDGGTHDPDVIAALVAAYVDGDVTDAQMAAWAMAVCARGLDDNELAALTDTMIASGTTLRWNVERPVVDKHSTGGVGDKISLILAPLCATLGCAVPMLSGRGLAHTGGTLDKLEAIDGFDVNLDASDAQKILGDVGCFIAGAGTDLVPADAKLYALRDHTGTVASPHLIAASIMSKKIAGGAAHLVVDTKWGRGAFCPTRDVATELAEHMATLAQRSGIGFDALLSEHQNPIGNTVGNACEVAEALDVLNGGGPADVIDLTVTLTHRLCTLAGVDTSIDTVADTLASGAAAEVFTRMVAAQRGDLRTGIRRGEHHHAIIATGSGYVTYDAEKIGAAAWKAGAGRSRPGEPVDVTAGITFTASAGTKVDAGDEIGIVEGADDERVTAAAIEVAAIARYDDHPPPPTSIAWASSEAPR